MTKADKQDKFITSQVENQSSSEDESTDAKQELHANNRSIKTALDADTEEADELLKEDKSDVTTESQQETNNLVPPEMSYELSFSSQVDVFKKPQ